MASDKIKTFRYLTRDELSDIKQSLPKNGFLNDLIFTLYVNQIWKTYIRNTLKKMKIAEKQIHHTITNSNGEIIDVYPLKDEIIRHFIRARVTPSSPIGIITANAISEPVTQMILKMFHTAGTGKAGVGLSVLRELLNTSYNRGAPLSLIYLDNRDATFMDTIDFINSTADVTIDDLLSNYDFITDFNTDSSIIPSWYRNYMALNPSFKIEEKKAALRLFLEIPLLIKYNLTPEDIGNKIIEKTPPALDCIPSPFPVNANDLEPSDQFNLDTDVAVIDIFIKDWKELADLDLSVILNDNVPSHVIFFKHIILTSLKTIHVNGSDDVIPSIITHDAIPAKMNVMSVFARDEYIENNIYRLYTIPIVIRQSGITIYKISQLMILLGIKFNRLKMGYSPTFKKKIISSEIKNDRNKWNKNDIVESWEITESINIGDEQEIQWIEIEMPLDKVDSMNELSAKSVIGYIQNLIQVNNANVAKGENERFAKIIYGDYTDEPVITNDNELQNASMLWYIENNNNDIFSIMCHPDVDNRFTHSNHLKMNYQIFGIETARVQLISEILFNLSPGGYIDPQHVVLIADTMTNPGKLKPMTMHGYGFDDVDDIGTAIVFGNGFTRSIRAAIENRASRPDSVVGSIITGGKIPLGTGTVSDIFANISSSLPTTASSGEVLTVVDHIRAETAHDVASVEEKEQVLPKQMLELIDTTLDMAIKEQDKNPDRPAPVQRRPITRNIAQSRHATSTIQRKIVPRPLISGKPRRSNISSLASEVIRNSEHDESILHYNVVPLEQ